MLKNPDYVTARDLLLSQIEPVGTERIPLWESYGRILAEDVRAKENVPPFDRSPYDGYAFRSMDTREASKENPVTFEILEEIPAGAVPTKEVTEQTAVRLMTGAPIPPGADAVIMFEKTSFTEKTVTLFAPVAAGSNIVRTGEDVKKDEILAARGTKLDPGMIGTLASQGISHPLVYRIPKVGILSTGNEVIEPDEEMEPGKIYNSNRYTLMAALRAMGCEPIYLGLAGDRLSDLTEGFLKGVKECDAVLSTGGVSVGDYDLTPEALEQAGAEILIRGMDIKPGMACAYAVKEGKLLCGLSGNPASSLTNFYVAAKPALKKLCGYADPIPEEISLILAGGFRKKSPVTRLLRGRLDLSGERPCLRIPKDQGNVVLSSAIGCDAMAIVPEGSGPIEEGTILKGFML